MFTDGYIFICNETTEKEFFSNGIFGAPRCRWKQVSKICATTAIFLLKKCKNLSPIMYGVFLPHGWPGLDIDESAWKGKFPSQVRVKQYYKFSSLPIITFNVLLDEKKKSSNTGFRITLRETLYLITKFIINTRFHLSHLVKRTLGEPLVERPCGRVDENLHIRCSMFWLKKLACNDQLECMFHPEFMHQGGTLNDFINAIRIRGGGRDAGEVILHLRQDWRYFLQLVSKLEKTISVHMPEIISILSQCSLCMWPVNSCDGKLGTEVMASEISSTIFKANWYPMYCTECSNIKVPLPQVWPSLS